MANREFDAKYISQYGQIIGIDEVGRGALAGPVVVGAVILNKFIDGIDDSKKLTQKQREYLSEEIIFNSQFAFGIATPTEVDVHNVIGATRIAMERAYKNLGVKAFAIVDGLEIGLNFDHECVVKGDAKSASIGAASIIAKVYRDSIMRKLDIFFEGYDFVHNVGYGTKKHMLALEKLGSTIFHRLTYSPVWKYTDPLKIENWILKGELSEDRLRKMYTHSMWHME